MEFRLEFRALGPVTVRRDGAAVDLGGPKQRAVLALLLVHRNTALPVDRILDELWGDDTGDKRNTLRVNVSRLRDALDPGRGRGDGSVLETVGTGYRLNVADDDFDVVRFDDAVRAGRLLQKGDPAQAATQLRAALDLWNGSPYEDFMYEDFAQSEVRRLSELRNDAVEDRIEADLTAGRSGELVSEIEVLRQAHPLRERLAAHQALALYRSGRPAEALRAIGAFRRHVGEELGIDPSPRLLRLEEQILLHDDSIQPNLPSSDGLLDDNRVIPNPYKGLRSFGADDAGSFFGRDALVAELVRTIGRGQNLIALVGASGSGKSSVVRAGLVPALAKGAIEGSDEWLVASMVPGSYPFAELEAALLRSTLDAPDSLASQLDDGDTGLVRAALRLLSEGDRLVLVIDQFEELFTLVDDPTVRDRFLSNLVAAVDDPHSRITVVVNLRADFYGQPLAHPEFGARLGAGVVNVTSLTAEELEAAALRPAEQRGVTLEPALLGQLIADVGNRPGSLPLFQYALTELFDRRTGSALTAASYRAMGGIEGALQRRASEVFDELDPEQQRAARQIFLRLVVVSEDDQRTRRRVPAREIVTIGVDTATVHDVLGRFGDHRLISFDSDPLTGAPTVEVAHEALLTAWPRLDTWIDASREDLRRHASLATALREWQLADRHPDYLLASARVAEFDGWEDASGISLNGPERDFLAESAARIAALEEEIERQRADDARSRRRLWGLVGALGVALGVAALFLMGVFAPDPGPTLTFYGARNADAVGDSIRSGIDRADRELQMQVDDVRWSLDPVLEFRDLAETNPEIVITDASTLLVPEIFFEHPEIRFGVVDTGGEPLTALDNVSSVGFRNEEGSFLAGAAAASTTETGIVGFVGGARIPLIEQFRAGFEAGARAVDPDVEVLATFVAQFGNEFGFDDVIGGKDRSTALYERGADVVFHAAGLSGRGLFEAADEQSDLQGRQLWAIGVDVDQWFDVPASQRDHVLTSMIKRQDVAAFVLAEHLLEGGVGGEVAQLGLADGGYDYSAQGDAMSSETIATLERLRSEIVDGTTTVPFDPVGPVLVLDADGNETEPPVFSDTVQGVDFEYPTAIEAGTYELTALGTPVTISIEDDWTVVESSPGFTFLTRSDANPSLDGVVLLRPTVFADPVDPGGSLATQEFALADALGDLDRFDGWLDQLPDGILVDAPSRVDVGGREATYFEVDIVDDFECGREGFCAGLLINTITSGNLSGWAFQQGLLDRVWVVDGGEFPPLVIVAETTNDDPILESADALIDTLVIGDPKPHPVDPADSGLDL